MTTKKDNPNAFKLLINKNVVERMADSLSTAAKIQSSDFNKTEFLKSISKLTPLELKARVRLLRDALKASLPANYPKALKILLKSLKENQLSSFDLWPYTEFIQTYGLEHLKISLDALAEITQRFTAEFAVRPFIKNHTKETLAYLLTCTKDKNEHLRRWSSEGSRSRLPWGERLDVCIQNPKLTLPILEALKYDDFLYVRKSVANHLNDITKDNPNVALVLLKKWNDQAPSQQKQKIQWITKQALRSLIKAGDQKALALMGVSTAAKIKVKNLNLNKDRLRLNDHLEFAFEIISDAPKSQKLIVDYIIHHQKAGGKLSPKVFKLKSFELLKSEKTSLQKKHSLKPVTTRKYYPGLHRLEIQINGKVVASKEWHLIS